MKLFTVVLVWCALFHYSAQAQKLYSDYYIHTPSDSVVAHGELLTDEEMQSKFKRDILSKQDVRFQNATFIRDNNNRQFELIRYGNRETYLRSLVKGHYNLYSIDVKKADREFIIISKADTIILSKEDKITGRYKAVDTRYRGLLMYLATDYPELKKRIAKVKFNPRDIQNIVYDLNTKFNDSPAIKYKASSTRDYIQVGLIGMVTNNKKNFAADVMFIRYFTGLSKNTSLRTGLKAAEFSREYDIDGTSRSAFKRITYSYVALPVLANFEFTNYALTPYFYLGIEPLYYGEASRTQDLSSYVTKSSGFWFGVRYGAGIKFKITPGFNLKGEYKSESLANKDKKQNLIVVGAEFNFSLDGKK